MRGLTGAGAQREVGQLGGGPLQPRQHHHRQRGLLAAGPPRLAPAPQADGAQAVPLGGWGLGGEQSWVGAPLDTSWYPGGPLRSPQPQEQLPPEAFQGLSRLPGGQAVPCAGSTHPPHPRSQTPARPLSARPPPSPRRTRTPPHTPCGTEGAAEPPPGPGSHSWRHWVPPRPSAFCFRQETRPRSWVLGPGRGAGTAGV